MQNPRSSSCSYSPAPIRSHLPIPLARAVAFKIYDIGHTGAIEPSELKRFLVATMAENPDIDFDEAALEAIVNTVGRL